MTVQQNISAATIRGDSALDWPLRFAAVIALALALYVTCWSTEPPDMRIFLLPWYENILDQGRIGAFAHPFSNYTPPYLYLLSAASLADGLIAPMSVIKLLSVAGTAFLALAVSDLLKAVGSKPRWGVLTILLPTAVLNSALLGQCDALWAGACLLAVASIIRGSTFVSVVWCGVAIAFKAQAAFVAPFIIGAMLGRKAPAWQWAVPAAVFILLMLPAFLLGWPASDLATIYVRQVEYFDFPGTLANPWFWGTVFAPDAAKGLYPIGYALAAAAALATGTLAAQSVRHPHKMLRLALLSALALPFLLPKMHERYLFLADVLALALALSRRDPRTILIAITVQLTSLLALLSYMYDWAAPALAGSLVGATALALIVLDHFAASHDESDALQHFDIGQRIA